MRIRRGTLVRPRSRYYGSYLGEVRWVMFGKAWLRWREPWLVSGCSECWPVELLRPVDEGEEG